jgi:ribonuclease R
VYAGAGAKALALAYAMASAVRSGAPVTLSEKVLLDYFERSGRNPLKIRDVARALDVPRGQLRELRELVRKLEDEGKLRRGSNRRYQSLQSPDLVVGRLQGVRGGFAFILRDDAPDVYVSAENLGDAVHGDVVLARLRRHRGRLEGIVERVQERARQVISGTLENDQSGWFLSPDEERIARDVNLTASTIQPQDRQRGHKALVRIAGSNRDGELVGEIVTILGPPDQPGVRSLALMAQFDLSERFEDAVLASVEDVRPPAAEELARREDLSALLAFTIDPLDAKDHDDAVSIERLGDGGFELGVHIADVSHYVQPDTLADQEGERRATSVYLADRVVPMLPEILSNYVCSLRPGVPRLTLSALMRFDAQGVLQTWRLAESWIVSCVKLSYQAAEALLGDHEPDPAHLATLSSEESGEPAWPAARPWEERRVPVHAALLDMLHLSRLMRERRMAAGSLDIETTELKVMHDVCGRVVSIEERPDLESYRLIEEFMLMANQVVARSLAEAALPLLWRAHSVPDAAKTEELRLFLKKLGIVWSPHEEATNQDYQRLLHAIERRPERKYLMYKVLRSLQKARYEARPEGHFGLAFAKYIHFTSPIRRYPDLYNHRLVRLLLGGKPRSDADGERHGSALEALAAHTSRLEVAAADCERASLKLKVCELLLDRLGDTTTGFISSIVDYGFYVDLPEWNAEGLVHVNQLTDDDYAPDKHHTQLLGSGSRRTFRFGQQVRVQLARVDPDRRQIDLAILKS